MSEQDISPEDQQMQDIQAAYDLTYDLHEMAKQGGRKATLTEIFGFAALGSTLFLPVNPLAGALALGAAYVYSAMTRRETSLSMAAHFNDVASKLGGHARDYLRDLDSEFKDVEDFSVDDINPVKLWERKNYAGLAMMGMCVVLMAPTFIPIALSMAATETDRTRGRNIKVKSFLAGSKLHDHYGDRLRKPLDP